MENTITKAQRVLEFIGSAPDGRTLKEIQTFILDMNGREKWLDRGYLRYNPRTGVLERTYKGRGYWTDYLYGTTAWGWSECGFLHTHCIKLPSGKWKVTEPIEGPWRGKKTKSLQYNQDVWRGAGQRYIESLPKCKHCQDPLYKFSKVSPDGQAHFVMTTMSHAADCMDRVWRVDDMNASYNTQTFSLTKLNRGEVAMLEKMARLIAPDNWELQRNGVWKELGNHIVEEK